MLSRPLSLALLLPAVLGFASAAAAQDKTLTVYTYGSFLEDWGPGPAVTAAYEAHCQCKIDWVAVDSSIGILSRLQLEGDRSTADVALGLDMNLVATADDTGLFAPHGLDLSALTLPMAWTQTNWVPFDWGHFAFVYDSQALPNPPTSLQELVDAPDSLKILIEDPRTSTPGLGLLLWMQKVFGDKAPGAWAKLSDNIVTVTQEWSEAYGMFQKGEAPMVLSYTTSPAYHIEVDHTDRYKAARFSEGHYIQVEVAAKLKRAPHPELADDFLRFMTTAGFQAAIPTTNWMYPVTPVPVPDAFAGLIDPEPTLVFSPEVVRDNRKAWTDAWLKAMAR
jgi:thiamine transport system substrate-binding protein